MLHLCLYLHLCSPIYVHFHGWKQTAVISQRNIIETVWTLLKIMAYYSEQPSLWNQRKQAETSFATLESSAVKNFMALQLFILLWMAKIKISNAPTLQTQMIPLESEFRQKQHKYSYKIIHLKMHGNSVTSSLEIQSAVFRSEYAVLLLYQSRACFNAFIDLQFTGNMSKQTGFQGQSTLCTSSSWHLSSKFIFYVQCKHLRHR